MILSTLQRFLQWLKGFEHPVEKVDEDIARAHARPLGNVGEVTKREVDDG